MRQWPWRKKLCLLSWPRQPRNRRSWRKKKGFSPHSRAVSMTEKTTQ